jgi:integral membrane protein
MEASQKSILKQMQILALAEGISYLSFGLTMPLKYVYSIPQPNLYVGMAHGILFIAYCVWVLRLHFALKLKYELTGLFLFASLVPFMTFWIDSKYLKKIHESDELYTR